MVLEVVFEIDVDELAVSPVVALRVGLFWGTARVDLDDVSSYVE